MPRGPKGEKCNGAHCADHKVIILVIALGRVIGESVERGPGYCPTKVDPDGVNEAAE